MNRDTKIYIALAIIVIVIIAGIYYFKNNNSEPTTEEVMKCIAGKAVLYSQTGCSHCITQEQILGKYLDLFTNINCAIDGKKCIEENITGTPTWIIDGEKFQGSKSIQELKELTKC
ncbi:MAG: hypothetical protein PHF67_05325 [Candidatus Nanoarchaeia archaeon]|nr:hypothetical protein [Candidatus Nanoarchaeia archaeon]